LEGAGHFQIALKADAASGETAAPVTNIFETNKYVDFTEKTPPFSGLHSHLSSSVDMVTLSSSIIKSFSKLFSHTKSLLLQFSSHLIIPDGFHKAATVASFWVDIEKSLGNLSRSEKFPIHLSFQKLVCKPFPILLIAC
jgi:hypothetical protein